MLLGFYVGEEEPWTALRSPAWSSPSSSWSER